ncbi:uncharacterized protein LOC113149112 isoform X2 [Anabas testudineus]|uniref:uncharacterized protein LOC113149112 isoform X2 n=1 Tax=Anabas testudineus TaxID=64144 RepID=UPI000E464E58|nr:uncharacterized protein LOC113149112 isoform X2 [Anabas testudineus]
MFILFKKQQLRDSETVESENKRQMRERRTMAELKRIQMILFLILILQFSVTGQYTYFTVRDRSDVTLPCGNVIDDQDTCLPTWMFKGSEQTATVELVKHGKIEQSQSKSDRLSVTENCSLVIKKVTAEDVGLYTCRQFISGRQQDGDSVIDLSVVTISEPKDGEKVKFNCFVWTYGNCRHTVKWLYQDKEVDKGNKDLETLQSGCNDAVHFLDSHFIYSSRFKLVQCKVTDLNTGVVQQFHFSPPSSKEKTGEDTEPGKTRSTRTPQIKKAATTTTGIRAASTNLKGDNKKPERTKSTRTSETTIKSSRATRKINDASKKSVTDPDNKVLQSSGEETGEKMSHR